MSRKRPVVLLVEDEALLRVFEADLLRDAGFEVFEAADADEALRELDTRGDVRVLFTDVHMPGSRDGLELARCVHERWPDIELLIASGSAGQGVHGRSSPQQPAWQSQIVY